MSPCSIARHKRMAFTWSRANASCRPSTWPLILCPRNRRSRFGRGPMRSVLRHGAQSRFQFRVSSRRHIIRNRRSIRRCHRQIECGHNFTSGFVRSSTCWNEVRRKKFRYSRVRTRVRYRIRTTSCHLRCALVQQTVLAINQQSRAASDSAESRRAMLRVG